MSRSLMEFGPKFLPILLFVLTSVTPMGGQVIPEARIHPSIPLLDSVGRNVLETGNPVSPLTTCGECHDADYIVAHSRHSGPGLAAAALPPWAVSSRPWTAPIPDGAEMNCFLCHTPRPANEARVEVLGADLGPWAATATLENSGIVAETDSKWVWSSSAFDSEGNVLDALLGLQGPTSHNCAQCHGVASDDNNSPITLTGLPSGSLQTLSRGEIFSPQLISESGVNLAGKDSLARSWDVHAERLLECSNCHFSVNNPIYRDESDATQPRGLIFDSRRMPVGAYLQRPNHNFAGQSSWTGQTKPIEPLGCQSCHDPEPTHTWLPYADRHMDALACEVCHSPALYSVAVKSVDWTELDDQGVPAVTWRGCAAGCETAATDLVRGIEPAILAREYPDGRVRLAPYNLVTSWYWVGGPESEPVALDLVAAAERGGGVEGMATRLEGLGVVRPRLKGEIEPYPVHHGIAQGPWATRDCRTCHARESRLTRSVALAESIPGEVIPSLVSNSEAALLGAVTLNTDGHLVYFPRTDAGNLYVLGHDSVGWANLLGIGTILVTILGIVLHGGIRWMTARSRAPSDHGGGPPVYMYKTYERVWHWLQALAIMILLFTGMEIHVTSLGLMDFALAVRIHNILGFVVVANAVFAALFHLASGEIKQYLPEPRGFFGQAITQARFYLTGIFRGDAHPFEKSPERKLNPLQQITYLVILNLLLPLQMVTGLLIWGVQRWPAVDDYLGGLPFLAPLHALGAWLFAAFLLMHVYLTTTGPTPTANLKAMVVGWENLEAADANSEAS